MNKNILELFQFWSSFFLFKFKKFDGWVEGFGFLCILISKRQKQREL